MFDDYELCDVMLVLCDPRIWTNIIQLIERTLDRPYVVYDRWLDGRWNTVTKYITMSDKLRKQRLPMECTRFFKSINEGF